MANGDVSYPKIPDVNWWGLRELFKKKVPTTVSATYLSSALSMGEASAKANIIGPFKKIGIIDDNLKPTDLAYEWRDDHKYSAVCEKILEAQYPQEIKDLFHTPDADLQKISNWFMSSAKCGQDAAKKYARFYLLLLKADVHGKESPAAKKELKPKSTPAQKSNTQKTSQATKKPTAAQQHATAAHSQSEEVIAAPARQYSSTPDLHINIQLHISPESTADQIDKIFESMAKHLKHFQR
ncbi:hypothetical protein CT157_13060 [Pseudomonas syringae]|uniref:Uncharacterized protein n=1 Tax=Pseudomonas syringae TaxID=317 RepID=A0A3T0JTV1_PSESX|nr:hypothetical protein CT157_13060 [Pseudomonas syringae]